MKSENHSPWIIIGSGPGAACAGNILSKKFGSDVLMLEEGIDPESVSVKPHTLLEMKTFAKNAGMNYVPGSSPLILSEGKVLGGGSEINTGLYWSLPEDIRKKWELEFKVSQFSSQDLKSFQEMAEKILGLEREQHDHDVIDALRSSAQKSGSEWLHPRVWWTKNNRNSLRHALIRPSEAQGLKVLTGMKVESIERSQKGWRVNTLKSSWTCDHLVVGAGIFSTLKLLSSYLDTLLSVDFHPQVRLLARFPAAIDLSDEKILPYQVRQRDVTMGFSGRKLNLMLALMGHSPDFFAEIIEKHRELVSLYGTVHIDSKISVLRGSAIRHLSYSHQDQLKLAGVMSSLIQWVDSAGAAEFLPVIHGPSWNRQDVLFSELKLTSVHLMGGLGMGETNLSKLDSFGRVKGETNLYVSDASIFNGSLGVNPQGALMMVALRNATEWTRS